MGAIQETNLELLVELRKHLDQAAQLRTVFDRLCSLAEAVPGNGATNTASQPRESEGRRE